MTAPLDATAPITPSITPPITARANPADPPDLARTKAAAREFEAMFLGQMLSPIFESLPTDGPFGGGNSEEAFRSLLVGEYAKAISKRSPIGVADQMVRGLLQAQEVPVATPTGAADGSVGNVAAGVEPASAVRPDQTAPKVGAPSSPLSRGA